MASTVQLTDISLPAPTTPPDLPRFTEADFMARLDALQAAIERHGLQHVIVYGDVTAFANVYYLTGYAVRFEQTLLVITPGRPPVLLVGHEGLPYSQISPLRTLQRRLVPAFSLQGMPRRGSIDMEDLLAELGLARGQRVGLIGEKYYPEFSRPAQRSDLPSYVVDAVRTVVGPENVSDVTALMTDPDTGLRHHLTAREIAYMERSGLYVYAGVKHALENLRIGMSETEAAPLLTYAGVVPLSYPLVFGFEDYALYGLTSPQPDSVLKPGGFVHFGFGQWGANCARGGLAAYGPDDLPPERRGVVDDLYVPYFRMLARWYETLRIDATAGEVYAAVQDFVEDARYGVGLNPGHLTHWDEWTNSPFYPGSSVRLHTGMGLQCDVIAFPGPPYYGVQVEDSLVLADTTLRGELGDQYPDVAARIATRRSFMREQLGIILHESVLPLSNMQGVLFPYLLNTHCALRVQHD